MTFDCPFCLGRKVKPVGVHSKGRLTGRGGSLMECEECEKWYWADREEEAGALFRSCRTTVSHPQRCYEEIREIVLSSGAGFLKRRLAEFNHLCAECPYGLFVPRTESPERLRNAGFNVL